MNTSIKVAIAQERLRQAKHSFNVALSGAVICTVAGVIGIGLVVCGKPQEGAMLTAGGIFPISNCLQLAQEVNNRLDDLLKESDEAQEQ